MRYQRCFMNKINKLSFNKTNNLDFLSVNFIQAFKHISNHAVMRLKTITPWRPCHHVHPCVICPKWSAVIVSCLT